MNLLLLAGKRERHVGRQQIILALDLESVAREEEERGIALPERSLERRQAVAHAAAVLIGRGDHLEAEPLQGLRHPVGVVRCLPQRRDVGVAVVADHERHPLLSERRVTARARGQQQQGKARQQAMSVSSSTRSPRTGNSVRPRRSAIVARTTGVQFCPAEPPQSVRIVTTGNRRYQWRKNDTTLQITKAGDGTHDSRF